MANHELWHKDSKSKTGDAIKKVVGSQFFHPKSGRLYIVTGVGFDSQRERWVVLYMAAHGSITYSHLPEDFEREGRFLEVKE